MRRPTVKVFLFILLGLLIGACIPQLQFNSPDGQPCYGVNEQGELFFPMQIFDGPFLAGNFNVALDTEDLDGPIGVPLNNPIMQLVYTRI